MFAAIITWTKTEGGLPLDRHKRLVECVDAFIQPWGPDEVMLHLEHPNGKIVSHQLSKKTSEIYLMNDEGKNLDSYRWAA